MIITAALAWWNELPDDLVACVEGVANVADRIVAVDGSYVRYPEATVYSSDDEVDAIQSTADRLGLESLILRPTRLWHGQVEKRNYLYNAAVVGSDFMVVVDTDHVIHTDRDEFREYMNGCAADVVNVPFVTPLNPDRTLDESAVGNWHTELAGNTIVIPHIYRALPGMRVEHMHWCISALKNGERVWLWALDAGYPIANHTVISIPYQVEHRTLFRTPEQIRLSRGFLNDRERVKQLSGQEDDRPDLPRPEFSFSKAIT